MVYFGAASPRSQIFGSRDCMGSCGKRTCARVEELCGDEPWSVRSIVPMSPGVAVPVVPPLETRTAGRVLRGLGPTTQHITVENRQDE